MKATLRFQRAGIQRNFLGLKAEKVKKFCRRPRVARQGRVAAQPIRPSLEQRLTDTKLRNRQHGSVASNRGACALQEFRS